MKKKPTLYIIIIAIWMCSIAVLAFSLAAAVKNVNAVSTLDNIIIVTLLSINTFCISILWFGSVKDLVFSLAYLFAKKKFKAEYAKIKPFTNSDNLPKVALLYCTCNDFNAKALSACRKQNYSNFCTVILDDSTSPDYIKEIDKYRSDHGNVTVHRRKDKSGFKAGNLNSYLKGNTGIDYFVVLDSDEIIPPDYITSALRYFNQFPRCGAVQAKHRATKGNNIFQSLLGMCVLSNGSTVQTVKNFYGANALMGHGMMISRACYEKTAGFPPVVAEDISFAVDIKNAGYEIIYAPDIECCEEFPVNYISLKKRQCKWTQGNLEYMRKYDNDINMSNMKWFEKLDLKLSHYSLPIVPVLSFMLMICTIALGFAGYPSIAYSITVYSVMLVFLCSPLIPDILVYAKGKTVFLLIPYFVVNIVTYASLFPMMLITIIKGSLGKKATFIVTPKTGGRLAFKDIIFHSLDSIIFAVMIAVLSLIACGSVLPVIFISAGCMSAPLIMSLANINAPAKIFDQLNSVRGQYRISSDGAATDSASVAANLTLSASISMLPASSEVMTTNMISGTAAINGSAATINNRRR